MKLHSYKISLLLFLSAFSFKAHSQASVADSLRIDSLKKVLVSEKDDTNKVNTLNDLSTNFFYIGDNKNALEKAQNALALSEKIKFINGKGASLLNIGAYYEHRGEYPEAHKNYNKAIEYYTASGNKNGIAHAYISIVSSYNAAGDFPNSLLNIYKALNIYEETGDKNGLAETYLMLGSNLNGENNYQEALKNYFLALGIFEKSGDRNLLATVNSMIALVYFNQGNYEEALKRDSFALKYYGDASAIKINIASTLVDIGNIYEKQGSIAYTNRDKTTAKNKFSGALEKYFSAIKIYKEAKAEWIAYGTYTYVGKVYIQLNDLSKARFYLEESRSFFEKRNDHGILEYVYKALSDLDSTSGNFSQAYQDYKKSIAHHDSSNAEENAKKMQQITMQYQFDKKEAVTKAEQEKKDADAKHIKNQQYLTIAGLSVIVFAVIIIASIQYRNNRQKKKANLLLTQQKEKIETTLSELKLTQAQLVQSEKMASLGELTAGIAHEIQNPLNFVNNFSEVNKELLDEMESELNAGNKEEAISIAKDIKENEEKINHHGKRADAIVKGMLQHSRSSSGIKEPTNINALADEYLRLSYHGLRAKDKTFNATLRTNFDETIGKINIIPQDIGRVLLNLFTNAFYAVTEKKKLQPEDYAPTISVSIKKIADKVDIRVKDNGSGVPQQLLDKIFQPFFTTKPTGQGTGLGLSLSYDIIKAHGGELKVETKEGEGAEFIIQLPIV